MSAELLTQDGQDLIRCYDPRDLSETERIAASSVGQVPAMAAAARSAQAGWAAMGLAARKAAIARVRDDFQAQADTVARLLAEECGRPAGEAWTAEIVANGGLFAWWLSNIDRLLLPDALSLSPLDYPKKSGLVRLEAKGLIGLVTPWNLPVAIPLRTLVPALLAGNAVLWKPSEHTARLGAFLAGLFHKHLPAGVLQLVQGGAAQGAAVVECALDAIFFTGSVATGRRIAASAGARMIPASLELGGKDAAIVLADADLPRAVNGIVWAAFGFGGQNCAAVERCYVHASLYDRFVEAAVAATKALRPGKDIGPLVTPAQVAIVRRHIEAAVAGGATLRTGGGVQGQFVEPTVLTEVTDEMAVMVEETFGPVLPILPFTELDAVIQRANSGDYGLTTSVWTRDLEAGEALAGRFDCGVFTVNNHSFTGAVPDAAWTGRRATGPGVTNSRFALYEMTRPRTVLVDALTAPHEMWWYPYNDALVSATRGLTELTRRGGNKLGGLQSALRGLLNRWKDPT